MPGEYVAYRVTLGVLLSAVNSRAQESVGDPSLVHSKQQSEGEKACVLNNKM